MSRRKRRRKWRVLYSLWGRYRDGQWVLIDQGTNQAYVWDQEIVTPFRLCTVSVEHV